MYSVVEYGNGFVEILLSRKIKKRHGYAVAKNYEVEILCESGKRLCLNLIAGYTCICIF